MRDRRLFYSWVLHCCMGNWEEPCCFEGGHCILHSNAWCACLFTFASKAVLTKGHVAVAAVCLRGVFVCTCDSVCLWRDLAIWNVSLCLLMNYSLSLSIFLQYLCSCTTWLNIIASLCSCISCSQPTLVLLTSPHTLFSVWRPILILNHVLA